MHFPPHTQGDETSETDFTYQPTGGLLPLVQSHAAQNPHIMYIVKTSLTDEDCSDPEPHLSEMISRCTLCGVFCCMTLHKMQ